MGIERNLSFRDHENVELIDYAHQPPSSRAPQRAGAARTASRGSSSAAASARSPSRQSAGTAGQERPVSAHSEASTALVSSQEPSSPIATTFHVPPPPMPSLKATEAPVTPKTPPVVVVQHHHPAPRYTDHVILAEKPRSLDDAETEEQLLLATGAGEGETRGLKISRRHSVEVEKKPKSRKHLADDASFGGAHVRGKKSGSSSSGVAYSVPQGKELQQSKEWEAALQREFDEEVAREKENVRARERRRELEQRERRRAREHVNREQRALARQERERERETAKENRLARDSSPPRQGTSSPDVVESPESFL